MFVVVWATAPSASSQSAVNRFADFLGLCSAGICSHSLPISPNYLIAVLAKMAKHMNFPPTYFSFLSKRRPFPACLRHLRQFFRFCFFGGASAAQGLIFNRRS